MEGLGSRSGSGSVQIVSDLEAQKHTDPRNPDPEHCFNISGEGYPLPVRKVLIS
jgi:hypothetical protein